MLLYHNHILAKVNKKVNLASHTKIRLNDGVQGGHTGGYDHLTDGSKLDDNYTGAGIMNMIRTNNTDTVEEFIHIGSMFSRQKCLPLEGQYPTSFSLEWKERLLLSTVTRILWICRPQGNLHPTSHKSLRGWKDKSTASIPKLTRSNLSIKEHDYVLRNMTMFLTDQSTLSLNYTLNC